MFKIIKIIIILCFWRKFKKKNSTVPQRESPSTKGHTPIKTSGSITRTSVSFKPTIPRLVPVDRLLEVEILVRWSLWNQRNCTDTHSTTKPTLLFMPQLFGNGKTFFMKNAIQILRDALTQHTPTSPHPLISALLDPTSAPEDSRCDLKKLRQTVKITMENIQLFSESRTIYIDLSCFNCFCPGNFSFSLHDQIFFNGSGKNQSDLSPEMHYDIHVDPITALVRETGHSGTWFLCFDELGVFDQLTNNIIVSFPLDFPKPDPDERLRRFFSCIVRFFADPRTFVLCAGRSPTMVQRAIKIEATSKVSPRVLPLGQLSEQDIGTILMKTVLPETQVTIAEHLQISGLEVKEVANEMSEWTGGVPRLVEFVIRELALPRKNRWSVDDIKRELHPMGEIGSATMTANIDFAPDFSKLNTNIHQVYLAFLVAFAMGEVIDVTVLTSILDLLNLLCIYVNHQSDGKTIKLSISRYTFHKLLSYTCQAPADVLFLSKILEQFSSFPKMFSAGRFFELVIAQAFVLRTNVAFYMDIAFSEKLRCYKDIFPFFEATFIGNVQISQLELGSGKNVKRATDLKSTTDLFENISPHSVSVPTNERSASSDIQGHLGDTGDPLAVCSAKNTIESHIGMTEVGEEIHKCLVVPKEAGVPGKIVMILAAMTLTGELNKTVGDWKVFDAKSKFPLPAKFHKTLGEFILIPEDCQLVILGKRGINVLIGAEQSSILANYFGRDDKSENFENLVSISKSAIHALQKFKQGPSICEGFFNYYYYFLFSQTQLKIFSLFFF